MSTDIVLSVKTAWRIYLDVCCLNRPFDDQSQERVRMEAEAVKSILLMNDARKCVVVGSDVIDFEIGQMNDPERYLELTTIAHNLVDRVVSQESDRERGRQIEGLGFDPMDALHLACAEKAGVAVMLTTDDMLIRRASRHAAALKVRVANPMVWIGEVWTR
jgi:hypothetical protein